VVEHLPLKHKTLNLNHCPSQKKKRSWMFYHGWVKLSMNNLQGKKLLFKISFGLHVEIEFLTEFQRVSCFPVIVAMTIFVWFRAPTNSGWTATYREVIPAPLWGIELKAHTEIPMWVLNIVPRTSWNPPHSLASHSSGRALGNSGVVTQPDSHTSTHTKTHFTGSLSCKERGDFGHM
jgi:hypothetical protein